MRTLRWLSPCLVLMGCLNFQGAFDERCRKTIAGEDGGFSDPGACDAGSFGGGSGGSSGGGSGGGGGAMGGGFGGGTADGGSDAGTDAGATTCSPRPSRADSGCFGAGEWCFEHPNPMSNELVVAFTTPDASGVWAAGAGPTLLYWESGLPKNMTHLLALRNPTDPYEEPAVITSAGLVNDNVFLAGDRMDLLFSVLDGGFRPTPGSAMDWDVVATDARGRLYGIASNSPGTLRRLANANVDPILFRYDPLNTGGTKIHALGFDLDDFAYVTTGIDNQAFRFDVSALGDGGTTPVTVDAGRVLRGAGGFLGPVARIQDGGVIVGGVNEFYSHDGMDWGPAGQLPFGGSFATALVASDASLWVFGGAGNVHEVNSQEDQPSLPTSAYGAAPAPAGEAWVVGSRGMLVRVKPSSPASFAWPVRGNNVRDLFVTEELAYAAENEAILSRTASGAWAEEPRLSGSSNGHTWIAVAVVAAQGGGRVVWAIDRTGTLYRDDGMGSSAQVRLQLPPPFLDYLPRSAATLPLSDGGALLGYGRVILRLTETEIQNYDGGTVTSGILPDGGTPPELFSAPVDMITGLAETSQALVVTGHRRVEQTSRVLTLSGAGAWQQRFETMQGQRVEDISTCPDGSFVFAGDHGILRRLNASGANPTDALATAPRQGVDFASVWCGPNNEAWVLVRSGDVLRVGASRVPVRERTGWGRRDLNDDRIDTNTIRGNSSDVFISGGSSTLISRPLCPQ